MTTTVQQDRSHGEETNVARRFLIRLGSANSESDERWEIRQEIRRMGGAPVSDGYGFRTRDERDEALDVLSRNWGAWQIESVTLEQRCRCRVLLASSSHRTRRRYVRGLRRHPIDLKESYDALHCLVALRAHAPQVLVLDEYLLWGGHEGILALTHDARRGNSVPVVLLLRKPYRPAAQLHSVVDAIHATEPPTRLLGVLAALDLIA